jgi:two-component system, chemotaxis family, CheB/CheR fusion protein
MRILIVDDNVDGAAAMRMLLEFDGHSVVVVGDGPSALVELATFAADVVLLDIGLPGLDGYEVARRIRRLPRGGDIRLVAITGFGLDSGRARAVQIDAHLRKPVGIDAVRAVLTRLAARPGRADDAISGSDDTLRR